MVPPSQTGKDGKKGYVYPKDLKPRDNSLAISNIDLVNLQAGQIKEVESRAAIRSPRVGMKSKRAISAFKPNTKHSISHSVRQNWGALNKPAHYPMKSREIVNPVTCHPRI